MEYADLGSLNAFLARNNTSWDEKKQVAIDIASGIELLHKCGIIHGDVKLENVLVFSDAETRFVVKLSDFGFCCLEALGNRVYRGTRLLNAPEIRQRVKTDDGDDESDYGFFDYADCDVYSYGVAVWEIISEGRRFYSNEPININHEDVDAAEQFLLRLESQGDELAPYANAFLESLVDILPSMRTCFGDVFAGTLRRNPDHRFGIIDIRSILDPGNKSEPKGIALLGAPRYSIFDICTASLPWSIRVQLVENLRAGAYEDENKYAGVEAFNLAACHAIGFGVQLDERLAFEHLRLAVDRRYLPARVLYEAFVSSGVICAPSNITSCDAMDQLLGSEEEKLMRVPQALRFAQRIRAYYKGKNSLSASATVKIGKEIFSPQALESFLHDHSIEGLNELWVTLDLFGEKSTKPLIHHLIVAYEALADDLLRRGLDGYFLTESRVSLVHIACICGSTKILFTLLELFPTLATQCTEDGVSPLHWLFMFEDAQVSEVAQALVRHGSSVVRTGLMMFTDFNLVFSGSPLHWVIMARNHAAVQALIEVGADVNDETLMRPNCLEYSGFPVDLAVCLLMPEIVKTLVQHGAHIGNRSEDAGRPAIHFIGDVIDPFRLWLYHGQHLREATKETIDVLLCSGADVNQVAVDDTTPLQWIVGRTTCETHVLESFLEFSPLASTKESSTSSPIYLAAAALQHDHINSAKTRLILEYCKPILDMEEFASGCTLALTKCAEDGTAGAARELLSACQSHARSLIDSGGLMHLAAEGDHVEIMSLFAQGGADINLDSEGTPAACAASLSKIEALGALLSQGASVLSMPTNNDSQRTLLHEITSDTTPPHESSRTMRYVCENFCPLLAPVVDNFDGRGFTALHKAVIWGNLQNIALLLESLGATPFLCVQGTDVDLRTLASLARKHPPSLVVKQGQVGLERYKSDMSSIEAYLTETWGLVAQASGDVVEDHKITWNWTRDIDSIWSPSDQVNEWYHRVLSVEEVEQTYPPKARATLN